MEEKNEEVTEPKEETKEDAKTSAKKKKRYFKNVKGFRRFFLFFGINVVFIRYHSYGFGRNHIQTKFLPDLPLYGNFLSELENIST